MQYQLNWVPDLYSYQLGCAGQEAKTLAKGHSVREVRSDSNPGLRVSKPRLSPCPVALTTARVTSSVDVGITRGRKAVKSRPRN